MGNCCREPTPVPFEIQFPASVSEANDLSHDFPLSKRVSLATNNEIYEGRKTPANPFAVESPKELRKSLENLVKQIDESKNWQEGRRHVGKFTKVMAETRRLEAKLEKLQRHSLNPTDLPSHKTKEEDYLALEKELQLHMDVILEEMSDLKEDVADLELHVHEMKSKSFTRTQTS